MNGTNGTNGTNGLSHAYSNAPGLGGPPTYNFDDYGAYHIVGSLSVPAGGDYVVTAHAFLDDGDLAHALGLYCYLGDDGAAQEPDNGALILGPGAYGNMPLTGTVTGSSGTIQVLCFNNNYSGTNGQSWSAAVAMTAVAVDAVN